MVTTAPDRLDGWPLSRLLTALDNAERVAGPDSATARVLARVIRERMAADRRGTKPAENLSCPPS
jgi:hypothetical protein